MSNDSHNHFTVVVTSDRYGADSAGLDRERRLLDQFPEVTVEVRGEPSSSEDELIEIGHRADAILVSTREAITRRVCENIPRVKVISRYGVGLDNVDLEAATDNGIVVTHYPQYCTSEVADHAMSLLLALNRRIVELDHDLREGAWEQRGAATTQILRGPVPALRTLTLGIVGFGRIGQAVAKRAAPFGPRLLVSDPYVADDVVTDAGVESVTMDTLLDEADLVTLHCPLTPQTRGIIGAASLSRMKPDAAIVNTARGPLIDLEALTTVLIERPTFRAALDVVDPEPLPADSPLCSLPNVILTPHSAYYSIQSVETVRNETFLAAIAVLRGLLPPTVANPLVLKRVSLAPDLLRTT
ncbi:MAG: C-terminal binding protein [Chloroflexota bacterium]|nr:C-terminal binding protein [Chloroflexota bacterium]